MSQLRSNRRVERAGINALRTLLEDAGHIVQEIDGSNDHGEDLYLRFVDEGRLTSFIVAIQVKAGRKYRRDVGYAVPVGTHGTLWTSSNVPIVGVVFDPEMRMLYRANITRHLRENPSACSVPIGESETLTRHNIDKFAEETISYISRERLQFRPARNQSLRAAVAERFAQPKPEQAIGGNPNGFFAQMEEWTERHEKALLQFTKFGLLFVIITCAIVSGYLTYEFAQQFTPTPWLWTSTALGAALVLGYAVFHETVAGRKAITLRILAYGPIITYCALAKAHAPALVGAIVAGLGTTLSGNGLIVIFVMHMRREGSRKRRVRAAYGENPPA